ncbi:hypothetical protein [Dawidia soli]|uniref:Uncharacterized protein n=1 Tax=Dawidia soli TaxID=2782352 RepID=A0AAP2DDU4_9BACT|nr:hypothetical protein [Dawidia soli]MBT1690224.1 hypothetical protein [Dawidia soli]
MITWTATFKEVIGLRRGLFVSLYQKATESNVYYIVELDNSATRYEGWLQPFVGENEQGDLIFADGMVFRRATRELAKISEKNASLRVVSVSGNFATVRRGADFWVIDTLSGEERPIQNCNGPSIVALDESKVFVDDCSEADLLLFASGERANSYIRPFEIFARTRVGVATLGNYPLADVTSLREYNTSGELTFDVPYQAASGIISLSSSGDFFIVKERTRMVIVRRGEQSAKVILSDVKVTSFSAAGNVLHYVAETKEGQPIVGRYNLETGEDKLVVNLAVNARVHTFE